MFAALGFVFILLIFGCINFAMFRKVANYANAFLLLWCGSAALSALNFYEFYTPPLAAYAYIFLMLIVFEATTILSFAFHKSRNPKNFCRTTPAKVSSYQLNIKMLTCMSLLCTLILIYPAITGIQQILTRGFYYLRIDTFGNKLFSTPLKIILINFVQPCILAILTLGFYQFIHNKHLRAYLLIALMDAVLYILIFANRWILLEIIFIALIILLDHYGLNIKKMVLQNRRLVVFACLLLSLIVIITMKRQISGSRGLLYNVYTYFVGNFHLFGIAIDDPQTLKLGADNFLYGKCLFSAPLTLLEYFSAFTGIDLPVKSGLSIINETTQQYYMVSPVTKMNNNFTMLYSFLRDGGIIGIIINTSLLSLAMHSLYTHRNQSLTRKLLYIFVYSILLFMTFEWFFGRLFVMMTIIAIIILTRLFVTPVKSN